MRYAATKKPVGVYSYKNALEYTKRVNKSVAPHVGVLFECVNVFRRGECTKGEGRIVAKDTINEG